MNEAPQEIAQQVILAIYADPATAKEWFGADAVAQIIKRGSIIDSQPSSVSLAPVLPPLPTRLAYSPVPPLSEKEIKEAEDFILDVEDELRVVIAETLRIKEETIFRDLVLGRDIARTDREFVLLLEAIEDEFDLDIPDEEAVKFITVQDVIDYLVDHLP